MDSKKLADLVDQLDDNIDDLEESLEPLLSTAFSAATNKLPVLDRAKLYVLVTYTIESLLFSYVRLHGENAKQHPVFRELTRVRLYFEKLKEAEGGGDDKKQNMSLDKQAAGRHIRYALAGNEKYDKERAELEAKNKALARVKLQQMAGKKRSAPSDGAEQEPSDSNLDESTNSADANIPTTSEDQSTHQKDSNSGRKHRKNKNRISKREKNAAGG